MANELKVDVLAVMDAASDACPAYSAMAKSLLDARAAVAELIEADVTYNVTQRHKIEADNAILRDRSDDAFRRKASCDHAFDRACERRADALARVKGVQNG